MNNKDMMYMVYDGYNGDCTFFSTLHEAGEHLNYILDEYSSEGYPDEVELGQIGIYKMTHCSKLNKIAYRKNYTNEEWSDKGYSSDFDCICDHKIVEVDNGMVK